MFIDRAFSVKLFIFYNYYSMIIFASFFGNKYTCAKDSEIKMIIKGTGTQKILNNVYTRFTDADNYTAFNSIPSEIYVNNQLQNYTGFFVYNLKNNENEIIIKWNYTITNCAVMFHELNNIIYLDFSKFDSSKVTDISFMFRYCTSLTSINFHNFNTQNVNTMHGAFIRCEQLTSLNLFSFNTLLVSDVRNLFYGCIKLKKLNIYNFDTSSVTSSDYMFNGVSNLIYCVKDITKISSISNRFPSSSIMNCSEIYNDENYYYKIDSECPGNYNKYIEEKNLCINNCYNDDYYIYEEDGLCVSSCTRGYYNDKDNPLIKKCKCKLEQCLTCSIESLRINLCTSCEEGYYPLYESNFLNCSKSSEGYYLDTKDSIYKKCYESCKSCNISGTNIYHNCIECKYNYIYELNINNYKNCYIECLYYHYYDEANKPYCTMNNSCPMSYNKLIPDKNECTSDCSKDNIYKYEFRKICYNKCPFPDSTNNTEINLIYFCKPVCSEENPLENVLTQECVNKCSISDLKNNICIQNYKKEKQNYDSDINNDNDDNDSEEDIKAQDLMIESVEEDFTSGEYDTSTLDKGEDEIIETEKMKITLTTTDNQKNNSNNNETTIYLGECEDLLRKAYNISENEVLYMKKIDVIQKGLKIPKVEYDVYCKLNSNTLIKLNLTICSNSKVDLSIPIIINENLDKLNSSSGYYNDICYSADSDKGTYIPLSDRKNKFIDNDMTICQDGCDFSEYDDKTKKAKCSCKVKESSTSFADIKINKTKLYENFVNVKNIANINLLKCFNALFCKEGVIYNIGSYVIIFIILFHLICIIILCRNQLNEIKEDINQISFGISSWELVIEDEKQKKINKIKKIKMLKIKKKNKKKIYKEKNEIINIPSPIDYYFISNNFKINTSNPPKIKNSNINRNFNRNINIIINNKNNYMENTICLEAKNKENKNNAININNKNEIIKKAKEVMAFNDEEMNELSYNLALKYDKRSYCNYYFSLLKTKHILLFSFYTSRDYNSRIIKIDLFFISFAIYFTINALFFNDDTMHKIYEDEGKFDILYQLPQIAYSSIISAVLDILLKLLALSSSSILSFKKNKELISLEKRKKNLNTLINIKLFMYFIISTIFLIFFWYYLAMFCAIYKNTQIHLIKDTLISFWLSLVYPFIIYLLPGIFRIPSLSNPKKKKNFLYNLSQLCQML